MSETNFKKKYRQERLEKIQLQQEVETLTKKIGAKNYLMNTMSENSDEQMQIIDELLNICEEQKEQIKKLEAELKTYDNAHTYSNKLHSNTEPIKTDGVQDE